MFPVRYYGLWKNQLIFDNVPMGSKILSLFKNNYYVIRHLAKRETVYAFDTPRQYYRGNPDDLLRIREAKMEKARILRKERNMRERKGGETAGVVS